MNPNAEPTRELTEKVGDSPRQPSGTETKQSPTWQERLELVRALQTRALARQDPFVANLEVISGDLLLVLHRAWQKLEAKLLDGSMGDGRLAREIEAYRKLAREVTRSAQAARLLSHPERGGVADD